MSQQVDLNDPNQGNAEPRLQTHLAAFRNDVQKLKQLVEVEKATLLDDETLETPLHVAARCGSDAVIEYLLVRGGQSAALAKTVSGSTPAHYAAIYGQLSTLRLLLQSGTELWRNVAMEKDNQGLTVLHLASLKGDEQVVEYLLKTFSELADVPNEAEDFPIHFAAASGHLKVVKKFIKICGREVITKEDMNGTLPVYFAAQEGKLPVLKYLIVDIGADPVARDNDGLTSLHAAAQGGHLDVVRWLVSKLTEEFITDETQDGATPIHIAAAMGYPDILQWFFERKDGKTYVNLLDRNKRTPCHDAVEYGHFEALITLLNYGASVTEKDIEGKTPLMLAAQNKEMSDFIKEYIRDGPKVLTRYKNSNSSLPEQAAITEVSDPPRKVSSSSNRPVRTSRTEHNELVSALNELNEVQEHRLRRQESLQAIEDELKMEYEHQEKVTRKRSKKSSTGYPPDKSPKVNDDIEDHTMHYAGESGDLYAIPRKRRTSRPGSGNERSPAAAQARELERKKSPPSNWYKGVAEDSQDTRSNYSRSRQRIRRCESEEEMSVYSYISGASRPYAPQSGYSGFSMASAYRQGQFIPHPGYGYGGGYGYPMYPGPARYPGPAGYPPVMYPPYGYPPQPMMNRHRPPPQEGGKQRKTSNRPLQSFAPPKDAARGRKAKSKSPSMDYSAIGGEQMIGYGPDISVDTTGLNKKEETDFHPPPPPITKDGQMKEYVTTEDENFIMVKRTNQSQSATVHPSGLQLNPVKQPFVYDGRWDKYIEPDDEWEEPDPRCGVPVLAACAAILGIGVITGLKGVSHRFSVKASSKVTKDRAYESVAWDSTDISAQTGGKLQKKISTSSHHSLHGGLFDGMDDMDTAELDPIEYSLREETGMAQTKTDNSLKVGTPKHEYRSATLPSKRKAIMQMDFSDDNFAKMAPQYGSIDEMDQAGGGLGESLQSRNASMLDLAPSGFRDGEGAYDSEELEGIENIIHVDDEKKSAESLDHHDNKTSAAKKERSKSLREKKKRQRAKHKDEQAVVTADQQSSVAVSMEQSNTNTSHTVNKTVTEQTVVNITHNVHTTNELHQTASVTTSTDSQKQLQQSANVTVLSHDDNTTADKAAVVLQKSTSHQASTPESIKTQDTSEQTASLLTTQQTTLASHRSAEQQKQVTAHMTSPKEDAEQRGASNQSVMEKTSNQMTSQRRDAKVIEQQVTSNHQTVMEVSQKRNTDVVEQHKASKQVAMEKMMTSQKRDDQLVEQQTTSNQTVMEKAIGQMTSQKRDTEVVKQRGANQPVMVDQKRDSEVVKQQGGNQAVMVDQLTYQKTDSEVVKQQGGNQAVMVDQMTYQKRDTEVVETSNQSVMEKAIAEMASQQTSNMQAAHNQFTYQSKLGYAGTSAAVPPPAPHTMKTTDQSANKMDTSQQLASSSDMTTRQVNKLTATSELTAGYQTEQSRDSVEFDDSSFSTIMNDLMALAGEDTNSSAQKQKGDKSTGFQTLSLFSDVPIVPPPKPSDTGYFARKSASPQSNVSTSMATQKTTTAAVLAAKQPPKPITSSRQPVTTTTTSKQVVPLAVSHKTEMQQQKDGTDIEWDINIGDIDLDLASQLEELNSIIGQLGVDPSDEVEQEAVAVPTAKKKAAEDVPSVTFTSAMSQQVEQPVHLTTAKQDTTPVSIDNSVIATLAQVNTKVASNIQLTREETVILYETRKKVVRNVVEYCQMISQGDKTAALNLAMTLATMYNLDASTISEINTYINTGVYTEVVAPPKSVQLLVPNGGVTGTGSAISLFSSEAEQALLKQQEQQWKSTERHFQEQAMVQNELKQHLAEQSQLQQEAHQQALTFAEAQSTQAKLLEEAQRQVQEQAQRLRSAELKLKEAEFMSKEKEMVSDRERILQEAQEQQQRAQKEFEEKNRVIDTMQNQFKEMQLFQQRLMERFDEQDQAHMRKIEEYQKKLAMAVESSGKGARATRQDSDSDDDDEQMMIAVKPSLQREIMAHAEVRTMEAQIQRTQPLSYRLMAEESIPGAPPAPNVDLLLDKKTKMMKKRSTIKQAQQSATMFDRFEKGGIDEIKDESDDEELQFAQPKVISQGSNEARTAKIVNYKKITSHSVEIPDHGYYRSSYSIQPTTKPPNIKTFDKMPGEFQMRHFKVPQ